MAQHTKGPWTHSQIINEECDLTAKVGTFLGLNTGQGAPDRLDAADYAEFEANVQLIAAAPELLEALEAIYIDLLRHPHDVWRIQNQCVLVTCRESIAKATGQDSQTVQEHYEDKARTQP